MFSIWRQIDINCFLEFIDRGVLDHLELFYFYKSTNSHQGFGL